MNLNKHMEIVNLLIKPASSNCNLCCKYCFYHDLANNRMQKSYGFMSISTLEILVKNAFLSASTAVVFAFQGGEPTLVGLPFYQKLIEFVNVYNKNNLHVSYSIQTNGILIDEDWCRFFKNNHFLVGISLDGTQKIHDHFRIDHYNQGSFKKVIKAIELLKRNHVEYNILSVVNSSNYQQISEIYKFFVRNKLTYLQFIPCLSPINDNNILALTPKQYESFLNQLIDLWYHDLLQGKKISIRYFDNLLGIILGYQPQSCELYDACSYNLVVESNGDVYPCDFYVVDKYRLGNISTSLISEIIQCDVEKSFIDSSRIINDKCKKCEFYQLCKGGCKRHRQTPFDVTIGENMFCESFYSFFKKNINRLEQLALLILQNIN